MPRKAPTPEKTRGCIRRLENIIATKPVQDALQNLIDDPEDLEEAKKDPKKYLASFGLNVPDEVEVGLTTESPGEICVRIFGRRVCVVW